MTRGVLMAAWVAMVPLVALAQDDRSGQVPRSDPPADVAADGRCLSVEDRTTSALFALRSEMMVVAVKCGRTEDYNQTFVARFQPILQRSDAAATRWFDSRFGDLGRGRKENFAAELVNVLSRAATREGRIFCDEQAADLITGLKTLESADRLLAFALQRDASPPNFDMCHWALDHPAN
jgi:hypothetical protein